MIPPNLLFLGLFNLLKVIQYSTANATNSFLYGTNVREMITIKPYDKSSDK